MGGCQEVLVKYADGEEEHVSLGRVIVAGDSSAASSDLTRHRGPSPDEMFKKHQEQAGRNVLATDKDYCKPMKNLICIQGMNGIVVGNKREANHVAENSDDEKEEELRIKRLREDEEKKNRKEERLAEIESRYCAKVPGATSMPDS